MPGFLTSVLWFIIVFVALIHSCFWAHLFSFPAFQLSSSWIHVCLLFLCSFPPLLLQLALFWASLLLSRAFRFLFPQAFLEIVRVSRLMIVWHPSLLFLDSRYIPVVWFSPFAIFLSFNSHVLPSLLLPVSSFSFLSSVLLHCCCLIHLLSCVSLLLKSLFLLPALEIHSFPHNFWLIPVFDSCLSFSPWNALQFYLLACCPWFLCLIFSGSLLGFDSFLCWFSPLVPSILPEPACVSFLIDSNSNLSN